MQCKNHPEIQALARCSGCQEPFCHNCLVELNGRQYCGSCKVMAVNTTPPTAGTRPCKEANEALTYAIIGIFCFGIILEPIALVKASKAKKLIEADPSLTGSGKVTAAQVIAVVALVLWVIGIFARISGA